MFLVKYLLDKKADPNVSACGCTALHRAAYAGNLECCRLLLDAGVDINAQDSSFGDLNTALHKAILQNGHAVIQLLLERGADLDVPNSEGVTARSLLLLVSQGASVTATPVVMGLEIEGEEVGGLGAGLGLGAGEGAKTETGTSTGVGVGLDTATGYPVFSLHANSTASISDSTESTSNPNPNPNTNTSHQTGAKQTQHCSDSDSSPFPDTNGVGGCGGWGGDAASYTNILDNTLTATEIVSLVDAGARAGGRVETNLRVGIWTRGGVGVESGEGVQEGSGRRVESGLGSISKVEVGSNAGAGVGVGVLCRQCGQVQLTFTRSRRTHQLVCTACHTLL